MFQNAGALKAVVNGENAFRRFRMSRAGFVALERGVENQAGAGAHGGIVTSQTEQSGVFARLVGLMGGSQ